MRRSHDPTGARDSCSAHPVGLIDLIDRSAVCDRASSDPRGIERAQVQVMPSRAHDLVIIGAGPVGALAAHAFARRGARVALIEASPNATSRFAGEWIQPPGVEVLDRLRLGRLEDQGARVGYGFVVIPDDGSPPIELPYPGGVTALACEHRGIAASLRERAVGRANVTYLPGTRALAITEHGVIVEDERGGTRRELHAELIVGADGRSSLTARHLGAGDGELQSYIAAIELRDIELPHEGFGHVVLGGPGPALLYRLDDDRVRACLDLPIALGGGARTLQFLWDGFAPVFPPPLREALRRALEQGDVMWAATRFRPRACYGGGHVIAIGDAVGHCHPLTAIGLSQGFLDAEAAASRSSSYPGDRARDSYAAELLAGALYRVLRGDDRGATAIRSAMYDAWRTSAALREQSMRLLMGGATHPLEFGTLLGRLAVVALAQEVLGSGLAPREALRRVASYRQWLPWGVAAVVPHVIRSRYWGRASAAAPLPGLAAAPRSGEVRVEVPPKLDRDKLARTVAAATAALQQVPPSGMTRLARTKRARARDASQLAQLLLATLEAPSTADTRLVRLGRATESLLDLQARNGRFGDPTTTALACRALGAARSVGGADDQAIARAQARAASWLRSRQTEDGAQPGADAVAHTAAAVEAWIACGIRPTDPAVRRAVNWLVRRQSPDGTWQATSDAPATALVTARATCALAGSHFRGARELGVAALIDLVSSRLLAGDRLRDLAHATVVAEALRALASAGVDGERLATPASRRRVRASDDDITYCRHALGEVSRTFALPIAMLPEPLSTAVSCGYLLCRIADTIEDHPGIALDERDRMFGVFLDVLHGREPRALTRSFEAIVGDDPELSLGRNCARVMCVFGSLDDDQRGACRHWIGEMARGMNVYVHRQRGADGLIALTTLADLERYCYFVAGTVGHLLTDLFREVFEPADGSGRRVDAEHFGAGLQMVNILKDIPEDRERGWSYIPRSTCAEHGLAVGDLLDVAHRDRAHAAVAPVFAMARDRLDAALTYALAVPPVHAGVRRFCLLPLWMAARTLVHARGNDALFVPGAEVKISRAEVASLIAEVTRLASDDEALTRRYRALWSAEP
ncbi:MAG: squalene/phytoene synthase family protein [Deltaproteobacteria bacterium]|nr:squalene/phytoene synthase family protein [Deltaproteobacteria bacterium]